MIVATVLLQVTTALTPAQPDVANEVQGVERVGVASTAVAPFPNFESGQVRPLLLAPDLATLYVLNTADHRVEIWSTAGTSIGKIPRGKLRYEGAIFTGLEPVSMCIDPSNANRMFVANNLSDTVSVVDLPNREVVATIPVGDEPLDVAVAGTKLFVATARSSENAGLVDPGASVENAVVVVLAKEPWPILDRVEIQAHRPRALLATRDRVWVIPQNSGNRTTVISEAQAQALDLDQTDLDPGEEPFEVNPALLHPNLNGNSFVNTFGENGWIVPRVGRIVNDDEPAYQALVPQLPDNDLLAIDVDTHAVRPEIAHGVGTTLFALAQNPVTGALWIVNTDALNRTRFEPRVNGTAFSNRITIVTGAESEHDLIELAPPNTSGEHAQPACIEFYGGEEGNYAYVGALGTATVIVLDAETGAVVTEISTGEVPTGLEVDELRDVLYVYSRFESAIYSYDIADGHELIARTPVSYDPEPPALREGRRHLYDARPSSLAGNGNMSCASCHVFGHHDASAWDLGNPEGGIGYFYPDLMEGVLSFENQAVGLRRVPQTHPMKGPMTTQSLRGLQGTAVPLHWRGDRRFFHMFRGAFRGLLGGDGISPRSMQEFANFVDTLEYPPNPFQPKDRVYSGDEAVGLNLFFNREYNPGIPGNVTCVDCHQVDFQGDFTGSQATVNFDAEPQLFNTAQLRGLYEKDFRHLTGYGTLHDGSIDGVLGFMQATLGGVEAFPGLNDVEKQQVTDLVRAWDSGIAPLVGAQITATPDNRERVEAWLDLAGMRAFPRGTGVPDVDVIGKGALRVRRGERMYVGLLYRPATDDWMTSWDEVFTRTELLDWIDGGRLLLTFTCVPPGQGERLGIDRDEDGVSDHVEELQRTRPNDPDTDDDGYADGAELAIGGLPHRHDDFLAGDVTAPSFEDSGVRRPFATTATIFAQLDEPAAVEVQLGTAAGDFDLTGVSTTELRRRHDLVLDGLPAGTEVHYRITASDRNGNSTDLDGSFTTAPPMLHVQDIQLEVSAGPPYTVTGSVLVVDQDEEPVEDVPVKAIWAGDIGGAAWFPLQRTDAGGVATFVIGPYTPAGPTTVTLSPVRVGHLIASDPFYVGSGGDEPTFFFNQSANEVSYRSISLR